VLKAVEIVHGLLGMSCGAKDGAFVVLQSKFAASLVLFLIIWNSHSVALVVAGDGRHFPLSILSHELNCHDATGVDSFSLQHSPLAVREEPLCHISQGFGSFPFLTLAGIQQAAMIEQ
jgi:hypothetical protein